jgi:hypothetical protein
MCPPIAMVASRNSWEMTGEMSDINRGFVIKIDPNTHISTTGLIDQRGKRA